MPAWLWIVLIVMGLFIGLPLLAYFCAKYAMVGRLQARELFFKSHKGDQRDGKETRKERTS